MGVKYHRNFVKNFKKRYGGNNKIRRQYEERLKLFAKNPRNPVLKDHTLKGKKITLRAFSITGDIRVVYIIKGNTTYFLDIGTHRQVY